LEEIEMNAKELTHRLGFLIPLVAVMLVLTACAPPEQQASDKPAKSTKTSKGLGLRSYTNLKYLGTPHDCTEEFDQCVGVNTMSIWKANGSNSGKPKKGSWLVDSSQEKLYYWEFTYKGPVGEDYLGQTKPITCKKKSTTTEKIVGNIDPGQDLEWLYQIAVFECTDDKEKGACLCKTDPRIEILN
jgi:hypothetical protein